MSTYEQFKQALFKACPEVEKSVMRLDFGCYILCDIKEQGYSESVQIYNDDFVLFSDYEFYFDDIIKNGWRSDKKDDKNTVYFSIIGRSINLEDVLMAIEKSAFDSKMLYAGGGTIQYRVQIRAKKITAMDIWSYGLPADAQSDETLKAIIKML